MKKESIKTKLMKEFGLDDKQVDYLIKVSTKDENGKIDLRKIEEDLRKIANTFIYKAGSVADAYTIRHELLSCGKSRQYDMVMQLLKSNSKTCEIADNYLARFDSLNVDSWVGILYSVAQSKLDSILKQDINTYREFVNELPNKDIGLIARVFDKEKEFAKYIAINGSKEDFEKIMTRKNKDGKMVYSKKISNKVFESLKKEVSNRSFEYFSIDGLLNVLPRIYSLKDLSKEQIENLQNKYIQKHLENKTEDYELNKFLNYDVNSKYETLNGYLDVEDYSERKKYIAKIIEPMFKEKMEKTYNELLNNIEILFKEGDLNGKKLIELVKESELSQNGKKEVVLSKDKETNKDIVTVYKDEGILNRQLEASFDGTKIKEIIDSLNKAEEQKAFKRLEEISKKGISEVKIADIYKCDYDLRRRLENEEGSKLFGVIDDKKNNSGTEYIIGGRLDEDEKLTDLVVKKSYNVIKSLNYNQRQELSMNEEQVKRFNSLDQKVDFKEHYYTYGRVDGYYQRKVTDFKACDKEVHIKNADWTNGGWYTLVWTGDNEDEKNYPEKAVGLSSSKSEWARFQRGVDKEFVMKLISKNPRRFLKFEEMAKDYSDCCGLFPTTHIEGFYRILLSHPTESELEILSIMAKAKAAEELKEKELKAKELLEKCENLQKKNSLED